MKLTLIDAKSFSKWMNSAQKKELAEVIRYFCDAATIEERSRMCYFANELREIHETCA